MTPKTYYVLGTTCSGKDFLIETAIQKYPDIFGAVQVGKEFRKRYPPEYFKGSGAPDHTEKEALEIFVNQHDAAVVAGKKIILVSAQPRRPSQVEPVMRKAPGEILWLFADEEETMRRMARRFKDDQASMELSIQRLNNDRIMLYDTLFQIVSRGIPIQPIDTIHHSMHELIDGLAHFGPLWEIKIAAEQVERLFAMGWPITYQAFVDNKRVAP